MSSSQDLKKTYEFIMISFLILVLIDYLILGIGLTFLGMSEAKAINIKSSYVNLGLIFRLGFILCFSFTAWDTYRHKILHKKIYFSETARVLLIISTIALSLLFVFITIAPLLKYIYPLVFVLLLISIIFLIMNFAIILEPKNDKERLGAEKEPTTREFGFALPCENGFVNITNPYRSVLIVGSAGAGKSASVIEPIIFEATRKNFTGFIYDFKFPTLGNFAYSCIKYLKQKNVKLYPVNFSDMSRTYRFNPIDPTLLKSRTWADEYSYTLYSNLDTSLIKSPSFFNKSAASTLRTVIWYMKLEHPKYCTLPHVISLILSASTEELSEIICSNEETALMVSDIKEAIDKGAMEQLAGVISTLKSNLSTINSAEVSWVLGGNDFSVDLNNPYDPKMVILGGNPTIKKALNPINAFICCIFLKNMNQQGKQQSIAVIDEGPTLYIPGLDETPATARSNKVCLVYSAQDFSQMDVMYGKELKTALISNLSYHFYGNVAGKETADYVSSLFGKEHEMIESYNKGVSQSETSSSSSGVSYAEQERSVIKAQKLLTQKVGEFTGKVVETGIDWFETKMKRVIDTYPDFKECEIPVLDETFLLSTEENLTIIEDVDKFVKSDFTIELSEMRYPSVKAIFNKLKSDKLALAKVLIKEVTVIRKEEKQTEIVSAFQVKVNADIRDLINLHKLKANGVLV